MKMKMTRKKKKDKMERKNNHKDSYRYKGMINRNRRENLTRKSRKLRDM
jgi:hypothetical protein